jgi:sterol desaturase/sphingolipid hydroxylase (fatty acid hydroxylase superfamily)
MNDWLLAHAGMVRFAAFAGLLIAFAGLEAALPRRRLGAPKPRRWFANLAIVAIGAATLKLAFHFVMPALAVGAALFAEGRGWGLLNATSWPLWLKGLLAFLALDCLIYWQHRLLHIEPFWRLHLMHHADLDLDASSGLRFHPLEIVFSMALKMLAILLIGAPAIAVLAFEAALNATSMFNHANLRLPAPLDRWLRLALVTPDMHRVHHSTIRRETDSNFGFNLPWWDRLFGTYRAQPERGHDGMAIGLPAPRGPECFSVGAMLAMPFRR